MLVDKLVAKNWSNGVTDKPRYIQPSSVPGVTREPRNQRVLLSSSPALSGLALVDNRHCSCSSSGSYSQLPGLLQWRVCRSVSGSFQPPPICTSGLLRDLSLAYQAMHLSCQQFVIRFIGFVILSVSRLYFA